MPNLSPLAGFVLFPLPKDDYPGVVVICIAAAGSVLVSYVKARAEGLGFTRRSASHPVERYIVLIPLLVFNQPFIAMCSHCGAGNITAFQRILHVREQGRERMRQAKEKAILMEGVNLGPLLLRWNGLLLALGIAAGALLAALESKRRYHDAEIIYYLFVPVTVSGMIGARSGISSPRLFPPFNLV
jgi:hypothetical protein